MTGTFTTTFIERAMESFTAILAPLTTLAFVASNELYNPGDVVKVPYCTNTSASATFSYATGFNTNSNIIAVKPVTLDQLVYQKWQLTDTDVAKLNDAAITKMASVAGEKLASDVIANVFANVVTDVNFPTSASCTYNQLTSSLAISDLVTQADNAFFPNENRNLILSPTAWNSLIKNTSLASAINYGGAQVVQDGQPLKVQGFTPYKVTAAMPTNVKGLVLNPNAILFAAGVHKVNQTLASQVQTVTATDKNGLTITLRSWYSPDLATSNYSLDCLFGLAVGNSSALFQMK